MKNWFDRQAAIYISTQIRIVPKVQRSGQGIEEKSKLDSSVKATDKQVTVIESKNAREMTQLQKLLNCQLNDAILFQVIFVESQ
jgi:hypothetical protein